jgi:hypothetical protein
MQHGSVNETIMLFDKHIASPPIAINAMLDFFQRTLAQSSPSSSTTPRKDDPQMLQ